MSDTLHLKRFNEYLDERRNAGSFDLAMPAMLNDLAHHLEQEHERNNQLEKRVDVLERVISVIQKYMRVSPDQIDRVNRELDEAMRGDPPSPKARCASLTRTKGRSTTASGARVDVWG